MEYPLGRGICIEQLVTTVADHNQSLVEIVNNIEEFVGVVLDERYSFGVNLL